MAESAPSEVPAPTPGVESAGTIVAAALMGGVWYYLVGLLHRIDALKDSSTVTAVQYGGAALFLIGTVLNTVQEIRQAARARKASKAVAQALDEKVKSGRSVAGLSAADLADSAQRINVSEKHLERLVEQRKQQLLIDPEYFQKELGAAVVDYLQGNPRNAKRMINRFRVNLLIAHRRGLLTSGATVTPEQIWKWLVLSERWPQLGRSLSSTPAAMVNLEEHSAKPAPAPSESARTLRVASTPMPVPWVPEPEPPRDPFMEAVAALALVYAGDEDLRKFIHSEPRLGRILERLVSYAAGEPAAASPDGSQGSPSRSLSR